MAPAAQHQLVDAVVIGTGAGGGEVAGRLADAGLDTVAVEEDLVGGERAHWACVPGRIITRAAELLGEARRIPGTAGTAMARPDWRPVARRVREATDEWGDKRAADALVARGVRLLRGEGRLTGRAEVTVLHADARETVLRARRAVVVATGAEPVVPPVPGLAGVAYWTHREAVRAAELPRSLLVLGGGATGVELGQAYQRFDCQVTLVEAAPRLLPDEEPEAGEFLLERLTEDGVEVYLGKQLASVGHAAGHFSALCTRGERLASERLLVACGRRVDLARVGVAALGVDDTLPALPVDERLRVRGAAPSGREPGVWAVGDVTGHGCWTHLALHQADVAVRAITGTGGAPAAYHAVPRVFRTDPEVGAVGPTEAAARALGARVRTARAEWGEGRGRGFVKLVASGGVLVGATVAGRRAGEALGAMTLAVRARVPVSELREVVWAEPTALCAFGEALEALT
jgi:pyruvate/2-oxoglutarate dehydrogenase complex dihydrolipoamide dehydrogenase (E3) component